ncbi:MAG TPA: carboxymuconolactone decarboxylase family protein [Burkholderiales bacterium]
MSHVATPAGHRFPWYVRLILRLQRRRYGRELEPSRLWGRLPRAFLAMSLMYGVLDRKSSPIEPALRSLVQVRVSQINGCAFCVDINAASSLGRGADGRKLAELARYADSGAFSEREKAALRYAEAVTDSRTRTDAAMIAALKSHFDDDAIIELTALIAYQNMSSKFNAALDVPAQGFCALAGVRQPH